MLWSKDKVVCTLRSLLRKQQSSIPQISAFAD